MQAIAIIYIEMKYPFSAFTRLSCPLSAKAYTSNICDSCLAILLVLPRSREYALAKCARSPGQ
jgi:hypothetical protein